MQSVLDRRTMAADTDPTSPWWYVLGTLLATLAGAILKTFADLVGRRDNNLEKWRNDLLLDIQRLREWNEKQQHELNSYQSRLDEMSKSVLTEQSMRHDLKNQYAAEKMDHEVLKVEYKNLQKENEELKIKLSSACTINCNLPECPVMKKVASTTVGAL